jgi:hypothetical protein
VRTVEATTLLEWIQTDYVALWQIADAVGMDEGVDEADVRDGVLATLDAPLRKGLIRLGHVYHGAEQFSPIDLPTDDLLRIVSEALPRLDDFVNVDLWVDSTPAGDTFLKAQLGAGPRQAM